VIPLPLRQQQVLDAIKGYIQAYGYPPTVREIARMIGVSAPATVAQHLDALERKGYLTRGYSGLGGRKRSARTLRLLGNESAPRGGTP
jgi:repressor LexA